ncbi:type II toxin-antitoxin system RelE/ParE family toxin [Actomonas aquatica]|uniref:Type II toxin-antitoxin system RelE/ParE family toxin n=1 Tax=Actomonas aquatica TaxID=2866162 RepID=A0ABZ1CCZ9_9BACT|nr:type II toxin-antitoxin system RelE/ParE family toxin [Opitutus sp. WL0086]WRQ89138.1 type II toxin-antitoxin system RelE/ParE family toxin [Opitutus sp. WL0086]
MGWSVSLNRQAELDLERAVAFLATKSPAAAERLGLGLVGSVFSLASLPYRGRPVVGRSGYRSVLHHPWFLIFYRIDEANGSVEIVRIWDARQDPDSLTMG